MFGPLCLAEDVALPEPIKKGLSRYADLKTLSMNWTQQYQSSNLARERLAKSKIQYLSLPRDQCLVWQNGYLYGRTIIGEDTNEFAFDGRIVAGGRFGTVGGKDRVLRKDLAIDRDASANYFAVEELQHLGIQLPHGMAQVVERKPLQSFVLYLLEQGARIKSVDSVQLDGRSMQRISLLVKNPEWRRLQDLDLAKLDAELHKSAESGQGIQKHLAAVKRAKETMSPELMYVFDLDPQAGYALRRWQDLTKEGRLRMQADCSEHQQLPGHQIWLPRKCQIDYFTFDEDYSGEIFDKPFLTNVLKVSGFDTKPVSDGLFTLDYNVPGANITDNTLAESKLGKGPVQYTVPVDLKNLDRAVEQARTFEKVQSEKRETPSLRIPLIVFNVLVIAMLLFYLIKRVRSEGTQS
jgi:hypothetical protein